MADRMDYLQDVEMAVLDEIKYFRKHLPHVEGRALIRKSERILKHIRAIYKIRNSM